MNLKLLEKIDLTHDSFIFRFALPDPEKEFGLHLGGHLLFIANIKTKEHPEGEEITRKYTPISTIH